MENDKAKRKNNSEAKGLYIVLALCVAIIGVSILGLALKSKTAQAPKIDQTITLEKPSQKPEQKPEATAEVSTEQDKGEVVNTYKSEDGSKAAAAWVWPVRGEIEREYSIDALSYDETMRDWRTHAGVDVLAEQGSVVRAASKGQVESIDNDDLYGTTVVINHGDGLKSVYSNLADKPAVKIGDNVRAGDEIGKVGSSALCEIGQKSHVHIAMTKGDKSVDPTEYLPD